MIPAILIALCAGILALDFHRNLRESPKGEKALYLILLLIAFAVLMLHEFGVPIPSPAGPIQDLIESITGKL